LRQQWSREGGHEQAVQRVLAAEASMLALAPSLQNSITALPTDIQWIAADHLRLSTGHGLDAAALRVEQFCAALSPSQWESFNKWWRGLDRESQDAILATVARQ
jgi:hypothetical protein